MRRRKESGERRVISRAIAQVCGEWLIQGKVGQDRLIYDCQPTGNQEQTPRQSISAYHSVLLVSNTQVYLLVYDQSVIKCSYLSTNR